MGPELIEVVRELLGILEDQLNLKFDLRIGGLIGAEAERQTGTALPEEVEGFCEEVFADGGVLLCGPGGGRFVYDLRARFDLFCKFTPIKPLPVLQDTGPLRPSTVAGVDMVIVRENVSGLYFSEGNCDGEEAIHTFRNSRVAIERILRAAISLAQQRRGRLSLAVKKAAVREASTLWADIFNELTGSTDLETEVLEIDNASYQIIANAKQFDVVVTPNMFGDILSDVAALLLGSRGMSFSGNFSQSNLAVYQTAHGAAHDLAGRNIANPIGQILSTAMLLRESLRLCKAADAVENAVDKTLLSGIRTEDIATPDCRIVGTQEMGQAIAEQLESLLIREPSKT